MKLISLLLLTATMACGDNDPAPVAEPVSIPSVALELPTRTTPGARVDVKWTGTFPTDAKLELLLRNPGDPVGASSAGYAYKGSAPARMFGGYIAADGSLSPTEVATSTDAAGQVSVALPLVEGDYEIVALVKKDDLLLASDAATTWAVTTGVRMEVSQLWVSPRDPITVDATVVGDEDMRLSAWLVTPDGTTLTLPGRVDNYLPVAEGQIAGDYRLLASKIGTYGNGTYLLSARLETLGGEERGFSGYEVHVCDTLGSYTGSGATPGGTIVARDLVFSRGASTTADDSGNFTLALPPGNYVFNGAGITTMAEVPCAPASKLRAAPAAFDPKVAILLVSDNSSPMMTDDAVELLGGHIQALAMASASQVTVTTKSDISALLGHEALLQALGGTQPVGVNLKALLAADYLLLVTYGDIGGKIAMQLRLVDARTASEVRSSRQVLLTRDSDALVKLPAMVAELNLGGADLFENAEKAFTPVVEAHWDASVATPGSMVTGYVGVIDSTSNHPGQLIDVDLEFRVGTAAPMVAKGKTGFDGTYAFQYAVPSTLPSGVHSVTVTARILRKSGARVSSEPAPLVIQDSGGRAKLDKPVLESGGESTQVGVNQIGQRDHFAIRSSDILDLASNALGKFDAAGLMTFTVRSKTQTGPATVTIEELDNNAQLGFAPTVGRRTFAYAYVVNPLTINAFADPRSDTINNGYLEIRGTVQLRGAPLRQVPISLDVVGDGTIEHATRTDESGVFRGLYRAPATGQGTTKIRIAVVKDARLAEVFIDVSYSPPCMSCPVTLLPGPVGTVERGGSRLISANQPVTWEAQGGTITNEGRFYAPGTGGTSIITAKSIANPANQATVVIVEDCLKEQIFRNFAGTVTIDGPVTAPFSATCTTVAIGFQQEGPNKYGVISHKQTCGSPPPNLAGASNLGFDGTRFPGCTVGFQTIDGQGCAANLTMHPDYNSIGASKWSYELAMGIPPAGSSTTCASGRYSAHGVIDAQ